MIRSSCLIALICIVTSTPLPCLQDSPDDAKYRIVGFLFEGLERCPASWPEEILGKGPGDVITIAELKTRAGRLLRSGLFADVKYKYLIRGSAIDITFHLEEKPWDLPVEFDNFIWFDDDVLHAAVAEVIPGYDGKIPNAGSYLAGRIASVLDKALADRGIAGTTGLASLGIWPDPIGEAASSPTLLEDRGVYLESPIEGLSASTAAARFAVRGLPLSICTVSLVGAPLARSKIREMTGGLLGAPYSRKHVGTYSAATIEPLFRSMGYLDVDVHESATTPYTASDCEGVELSLAIDLGVTYRFDGLSWKGDLLISTDVMEASMRIAKGSVCDEGLIRRGLDALLESYGALGYLHPTYTLERHLDREARRVVYDVEIEQGPVYYMGTLRLIGFSRRMEQWARSHWEIESGQIFDSTYPDRFLEGMLDKKPTQSSTHFTFTKSEEGKMLVDVTISYEMNPNI